MAQALAGVFLFAAAYRWFIYPAGLYSGGFTGIAQLIDLFLREVMGVRFPPGDRCCGRYFLVYQYTAFRSGIYSDWEKVPDPDCGIGLRAVCSYGFASGSIQDALR